MAFTIVANSRVNLGDVTLITGTLTSVTTPGTDAILPGSTIIAFWINHNQTDVDVAIPRVHINASDFAATYAAGSIHHDSSVASDVLSWTAIYK